MISATNFFFNHLLAFSTICSEIKSRAELSLYASPLIEFSGMEWAIRSWALVSDP